MVDIEKQIETINDCWPSYADNSTFEQINDYFNNENERQRLSKHRGEDIPMHVLNAILSRVIVYFYDEVGQALEELEEKK